MDGLYFSLKEGGLKKDEECYSRYGALVYALFSRYSLVLMEVRRFRSIMKKKRMEIALFIPLRTFMNINFWNK
jgi:hypothetical protein